MQIAEKFMDRVESSTGFSKLRASQGGHHNSVEDFLSLVAAGDIPHQDPSLLNVPLQKVMNAAGGTGGGATTRAQQQLLALASRASLAKQAESSASLSEMAAAIHANNSSKKKRKRRDGK
jgi:hypothetical protein